MPLKFLKASLPHLNFFTSILLILGIMVMSAAGAFMIRMQKGPIDLEFAIPRLEAELKKSGHDVEISSAVLTWPNITQELLIELGGVKISQEEVTGLSVNKVSIGLSGLELLKGNILPDLIIVDGPVLQLVQEDGSLNLFWQEKNQIKEQPVPPVKQVYGPQLPTIVPQEIRKSVRGFFDEIMNPENAQNDVFAALKRVELKNAVIKGQNQVKEAMGYLALADISLSKSSIGLEGDLSLKLPSAEDSVSEIKSDFVYRKEEKDLTFMAKVNNVNLSRFAAYFPDEKLLVSQDISISGDVRAAFDDKFKLQLATLDIIIPEGMLNLPNLYKQPVEIKNLILNANLNRPNEVLKVERLNAEIGGLIIDANIDGQIKEEHISAPIELKIAELPLDKIPPLVPASVADTSLGEWLTKKLYDGRLLNVAVNTTLNMKRNVETKERNVEVVNTRATYDIDGVTVKYSDTLMPVTKAKGSGVYENDTLTIAGESGFIGDVEGRDVKLVMTNISVQGGGNADLNLNGKGPLSTILKYAQAEPIALGDDLGFNPNTAKGKAEFNLQMNFPTVKDLPAELVKVKIKGKLSEVLIPNVVQGLPLTGGPFDMGFDDGALTLKGKGKLAERPIDLEWMQYLESKGREFSSKIKAQVTADEGLRKAFNIGLEDYISGPIPVNVTYVDRGVKAIIDVTGNLTPATLHIEPFDYRKAAGAEGSLSLKGFITGDTITEIDKLKVSAAGFSLENGRIIFKKLKDGSSDISQGKIGTARLGKTDVSVDFEVTPSNTLKIIANGSVVDITPFINSDDKNNNGVKKVKEPEQPMQISVSARKFLAENGIVLGASKLYLETNTGGDITRIEMDAKVGKGDMYLRFKPEEKTGKRTFRLESSDAGAVLKAFGLYDDMIGGSMVMYGEPQGRSVTGDLMGKAQLENFRVKKAPALAKLLSAMSLQGAQGLLKNDGLSFKRLESNFEWKFRDAGNLLVVKDGRTSGSALGLTFEGFVNIGSKTTDISGTIIPVSGVNNVVGNIPVLGKILTGGDALIAATYSMKGPSKDPKVSVNPLSVLAPGFLRKIFFEGDVDAKVKREEAKSPEAPKAVNDNNLNNNTQGVQQPVVIAPNVNAN